MDPSGAVQLLQALLSPDNATRKAGEEAFANGKKTNPTAVLSSFMTVLRGGGDIAVRKQAAVLSRKMCAPGFKKDCVWNSLSEQVKEQVKAECLSLLVQEKDKELIKPIGEFVKIVAGHETKGPSQTQVLPTLFQMASAEIPRQREVALECVADLAVTLKPQLLGASADTAVLLRRGFEDASPEVRASAVYLVTRMVTNYEKREWQQLQGLWPMILGAIKHAVNHDDVLTNMLDHLSECVDDCPQYFKSHINDFTSVVLSIAKARNQVEDGVRGQAAEILVDLSTAKPKMMKTVPGFLEQMFEWCLHTIGEVEDDDDWQDRIEDEEDDDEEMVVATAESAIDKLCESIGMDACGKPLFALVGKFANMPEWQARHAAMVALRQCVEYVDDDENTIRQLGQLALVNSGHAHMRVRFAALNVIGQISQDQEPHFQEWCYKDVMPVLMTLMDDPVKRVSAMAMSGFVCFGENLDSTVMTEYAPALMKKVVAKLEVDHRTVREEALTSIAAIAGVLGKEAGLYYGDVMPIVKHMLHTMDGEQDHRIRGKAFECMSLLGMAVGKERFAVDAREALEKMLKTELSDDNVEKEYIKEAQERICRTLKEDFAQFLPWILPPIYRSIQLPAASDADVDSDDETYTVDAGDGKRLRIKTAALDDMIANVESLGVYVEECGIGFLPHLTPTAQALLPLLAMTEGVAAVCEDVRSEAYTVWAEMIKISKKSGNEANAKELLTQFVQTMLITLKDEQDTETVMQLATGLHSCIKNAGSGVLDDGTLSLVVEFVAKKLSESFERSKEEAENADSDGEGEADSEQEVTEADCQVQLNTVFGALMVANQEGFLKFASPVVGELLRRWCSAQDVSQRVLGLHLVGDMLEFLKDRSQSAWPQFMDQVFTSLRHENGKIRTAAAYCVNLLARLPAFHSTDKASPAFTTVVKILQTAPNPKKSDTKARLALDNMICALISMLIHMPRQCAPDEASVQKAWDLAYAKLPLKQDQEESNKLIRDLLERLTAQQPELLGQNNCRLPQLLGFLATSVNYETEDELKDEIRQVFHKLGQATLSQYQAQFSEKQAKKIQRILQGLD